MKRLSPLLAALAATCALNAQADDYTVGTFSSTALPPFLEYYARPLILGLDYFDTFWFEVADPAMVLSATAFDLGSTVSDMRLYGPLGQITDVDWEASNSFTATLAADFYFLEVEGYRDFGGLPGNYEIWLSATPIPEPAATALLLAGLGLVGWRRRCRPEP